MAACLQSPSSFSCSKITPRTSTSSPFSFSVSCSPPPLLRTKTSLSFSSDSDSSSSSSLNLRRNIHQSQTTQIRAVAAAEDHTQLNEADASLSLSDVLTLFFKAEGTMNEFAISTVTKALEGLEGVSDVKVQIVEGIASVELTKLTTVQASGVASNLLEIIQVSGFRLQTLYLSFEDEEDRR